MHKFFDTNIFVYSIDLRDKKKQNTARELIRKFPRSEITISTQVLQEFYNVATTKLKHDVNEVKKIMHSATRFNVWQVSVNTIFSAIDISTRHQFSIWDSLILASAIESGCDTLYTEDLQNGQVVEGVKILNPFVV